MAEFDPIDFERREWVSHSGWPFGAAEIHPYLAEARALLGVDVVDTLRMPRPPLQRLSSEELAVRWWTFDATFDRFTIDRADNLGPIPAAPLLLRHGPVMLAEDAGSVERLDVRTPSGGRSTSGRGVIGRAGGIEVRVSACLKLSGRERHRE